MKKLVLLFSAVVMAVSVSAQNVTESKTFDNFYIGINGGVSTKTTGVSWIHHLNPNAGVRIGRWFTPVFGLAADGTAYFNTKGWLPCKTGTAVNYSNVSLLGTVNLSNWFGGYPGEPRTFEVVALYGFGWGHGYGNNKTSAPIIKNNDQVTSKAGLDFVFNLGAKKALQFYVEPSINYALAGTLALSGDDQTQYNINRSAVQLNAGFIYKFRNSNGTHNFTIHELDQTLIDRLNAEINDLRNQLNGKDADIDALRRRLADLQRQLDECLKRPVVMEQKSTTATNLQPTVLFRKGSSVIDPAQYAPIELIASYMRNHPDAKVEIKGYASPEGPADLNQKLSVDRANVVLNALVKKYKIAADRLSAEGCGTTDKLFEQLEFNRVATFHDTTK